MKSIDMNNLNPRLLEHLNASIETIGNNVEAHYKGSKYAHRTVAGELRKLLCDSKHKKDNSLIPRCFPKIQFGILNGPPDWIFDLDAFSTAGTVQTFANGEAEINQLFNHFEDSLFLAEWLNQKVFHKTITLKEIIKSVADKEGVHADTDGNDVLSFINRNKFGNRPFSSTTIIAIARYITIAATVRSLVDYDQITPFLISNQPLGRRGAIFISSRNIRRNGIIPLKLEFISEKELANVHLKIPENASTTHAINLIRQYDLQNECVIVIEDLNTKDFNSRKLKWYPIEVINANPIWADAYARTRLKDKSE